MTIQTERFVYEVSTTDSETGIPYTVLDFATIFGLAPTQRFVARCTVRCWSYNSSALDAEGSSSYGAYDVTEELVLNRDPDGGAFNYVPLNSGSPDSPAASKVHIRGRTDMVNSLAISPGSPDGIKITFYITGGDATSDAQTINHLLVIDIEVIT